MLLVKRSQMELDCMIWLVIFKNLWKQNIRKEHTIYPEPIIPSGHTMDMKNGDRIAIPIIIQMVEMLLKVADWYLSLKRTITYRLSPNRIKKSIVLNDTLNYIWKL